MSVRSRPPCSTKWVLIQPGLHRQVRKRLSKGEGISQRAKLALKARKWQLTSPQRNYWASTLILQPENHKIVHLHYFVHQISNNLLYKQNKWLYVSHWFTKYIIKLSSFQRLNQMRRLIRWLRSNKEMQFSPWNFPTTALLSFSSRIIQ